MTPFINSYHDELPGFYTELKPTPLKDARVLYHSQPLAAELGLDAEFLVANLRRYCVVNRCLKV